VIAKGEVCKWLVELKEEGSMEIFTEIWFSTLSPPFRQEVDCSLQLLMNDQC
jgi:hypothetical protein